MPQWEYRERTRPWQTPEIVARPRFVVLESGTSLQRLMARYLDGAEVVPVTNVQEALSELEVTPSQALLVNAASPAGAVRGLSQDKLLPVGVPVVVCSVPGVEQAASALRISDYLIKPISQEDLLAAMDKLGLSSGTVLIVDDEPDAVRLFRRMLVSAGRGYRVVRAGDGQEALDVLSEDAVDVILLDLVMPNLDGFQLLELKGTHPALRDIPVIVVSARDPVGHPIVSNALTVTQAGGLSVHHLLGFIEAATGLLSPASSRAGRVPQAAPSG
jgi:CheY-like chemotaxis protein